MPPKCELHKLKHKFKNKQGPIVTYVGRFRVQTQNRTEIKTTAHHTLLIIGWGWPEPNATAAGIRMLQLIAYFKSCNCQIAFVATAVQNEHSRYLNELGLHTEQVFLNCDSFDKFLVVLQPTIVLFDRFLTEEQFGWRVAALVPNALRILDTEDLHSLRHVREQCFRVNTDFSIPTWLQNDRTKREIASIYRCDLSLIISTYEMELLSDVLGKNAKLLYHLPFMVHANDVLWDSPCFEERMDFIFIGGGKHSPNIDAIKYLRSDIWPQIRKQIPNTHLNIYGAYLPQHVLELHDEPTGFLIKGKAALISDVMSKAKVCLAPLRFGAGIKGKLLHAIQYGTPSVTTSIGAEGMYAEMDWNGIIADRTHDFIKAAVDLYSDQVKWLRAQKNGYQLLTALYDKDNLEEKLSAKITSLYIHRDAHREQNFIGSLLQHQTMASTKFMSKWIQAKNKALGKP